MKRGLRALPFLVFLSAAAVALECPRKGAPSGAAAVETSEDCPWAGIARVLVEKADRKEDLAPVLTAHAPGLLRQLDADRASAALQLWGESINYDELARGVIVNPGILSFIAARLGAAQPAGRITHAGVEHTYGYLFSLLPTKFGFKRARWVRPDIESGLGLAPGSAGPAPAEGTLLANITCLAGSIALGDDAAASAQLARVLPSCAGSVRAYASRPAKRVRLSEEVALPGGRKVALRTDFVPFRQVSGGNSHLLVYSVYDSLQRQTRLITAFAVNEGFVKGAIAPAGLGADKPVQTRYNAYVDGFTGSVKVKGLRSVAVLE